jgi:transcriptional regulator with XRE-family HTH domain
MVNVATYLTTLRAAKGYSRSRLAELVGTTEMSILRIEKQGQEPGGPLLVRLIEVLGGSWDVVTRLVKADDGEDALELVLSEAQATGAQPRDPAAFSQFLQLVSDGMSPQDAARIALGRP